MIIKKLSKKQLYDFVRTLHETNQVSMKVATLLCGDRLSCCDEAVVLEVNEEIVGIGTIAPDGEMHEGQPTIVALYVVPRFRKQGYGKAIMEATVRRCLERGFSKVRVDVMSGYAMRAINSLSTELQAALDIHDQGSIMDQMPG